MKSFKTITEGPVPGANAVIMGHRTWESIPDHSKPLPDRFNVVISRGVHPRYVQTSFETDFESALRRATDHTVMTGGTVYVIGGADLINRALGDPRCDTVHVTLVQSPFFDTDVRLDTEWAVVLDQVDDAKQMASAGWRLDADRGQTTEKGITFRMVTLKRVPV